MGTVVVPGHIWEPEQCPGTYGGSFSPRMERLQGCHSVLKRNDPREVIQF